MGSSCCTNVSIEYKLEDVDSFDVLMKIICEHINRVMGILETSVKQNISFGETVQDVKGFNYHIKLESVLLSLKSVIEDYRVLAQVTHKTKNTKNKFKDIKANIQGLKTPKSKREERLEVLYYERSISLNECIKYLNDVLKTEHTKDLKELELLDFYMLNRIFLQTPEP